MLLPLFRELYVTHNISSNMLSFFLPRRRKNIIHKNTKNKMKKKNKEKKTENDQKSTFKMNRNIKFMTKFNFNVEMTTLKAQNVNGF